MGMVLVVVDPCLVVVVTTEVVVVEVEVVVVVGQTVSAPCRRQVRRTWRRHFSERLGWARRRGCSGVSEGLGAHVS